MAVLAVLAVLIAHIWSMHARKWLIVKETAKTAKTAMRIFCSGISNLSGKEAWTALGKCLKRKKHERWNST